MVAPGTRLGPYEVVAPLGAGGMGEVYRARDTKLGREVALKILPETFAADPDRLARFEREARTLASLTHPNLAAIYTVDEHQGRPFIVMELLEGRTLRDCIHARALSQGQIVDLAIQIADALDAAHARGVVHRDIKPENIVVSDSGHAKVLDFGVAKLLHEAAAGATAAATGVTHFGSTIGTVAYMSPEQVRGEAVDGRSDLFSLGLVLYEMATGRQAFVGHTSGLIFDAILNRAPVLPLEINPDMASALQRIVIKLLEKDSRRRYQTAGELRADLQRLRRELESGSRAQTTPTIEKNSIVVLPFTDISATRDHEYFADGLTDEIITDLSQIRQLRVISRNSTIQLKGSGRDLKTIAADLNVQYALEGTVRTAGTNLRVTAQLVDAVSDEHLWAEKYAGTLEDVFEIQETISRRIVDALKMTLSPQEDRRLAERPLGDVRAYECYHRARHEIYKFTRDGLDRALSFIQSALSVIGDNELLQASLGIVYWQYVNGALTLDEAYLDKAEECAARVLQRNRESAVGHELRGLVEYARGRRHDAVRSLRHACTIDSNCWYALAELERIACSSGHETDARALLEQMLATDPLSMITHVAGVAAAIQFGRPEAHYETARRFLEAAPEWAMLRSIHALSRIHAGHPDDARRIAEAAPPEDVPTLSGQICAFLTHALAGRPDKALPCFSDDAKTAARRVEYWSWCLAQCFALIDDRDTALDWLENAVNRGLINYPLLSRHDRILRRLHGHPRFDALLGRVRVEWEGPAPRLA